MLRHFLLVFFSRRQLMSDARACMKYRVFACGDVMAVHFHSCASCNACNPFFLLSAAAAAAALLFIKMRIDYDET